MNSLQKILESSKRTGQINLSQRNLQSLDSLFQTNAKSTVDLSFDRPINDEAQWWEIVDLTRLNLSDNRISHLDSRLSNTEFKSLTSLDLHNNQISQIDEIQDLCNLVVLNLNMNQLSRVNEIQTLTNLKELHLSRNNLQSLPMDIGCLYHLSILDVSYNNIQRLEPSLSQCNRLTKLNLSHNALFQLNGFNISRLVYLNDLDISWNQLTSFLDFEMNNECLTRLDLSHNQLSEFPIGIFPELKDLILSFNCIRIQNKKHLLESSIALENLDLRDNKLNMIPMEILQMTILKRLDITNNDISQFPPELGLLECVQSILYTGNKIKLSTSLGTKKLLSLLREKLTPIQDDIHPQHHPFHDLNGKKLTDIPEPLDPPTQLIANDNRLTRIPSWLYHDLGAFIKTLELSKNQITEFPMSGMPLLQYLDLSCNYISQLPQLCPFPLLNYVNLSFNKIKVVPTPLLWAQLNKLLLNDNRIDGIQANTFAELGSLDTLDLSNNSISHIPNEIALLPKLTNLHLNGNTFRTPRQATLSRGSRYLIEYLLERLKE